MQWKTLERKKKRLDRNKILKGNTNTAVKICIATDESLDSEKVEAKTSVLPRNIILDRNAYQNNT